MEKPLLTPNQVQQLSDQLAKLHQSIADADRIERCGFECGDIRATLIALSLTITRMLSELGNVPTAMIPKIQGANPFAGQPDVGVLRHGLANPTAE